MKQILKLTYILFFMAGIFCISCTKVVDEPFDPSYNESESSNEQPNSPSDENVDKRDPKIKELVAKCVSVKAEYADYMWTFTIESTLHHELPNKKIQFGIGHGEIGDIEHVSVEDDAYSYTSKNDGRKKVITFINPFWYYYIFGIDPNNLDIATKSSMYYASYKSLKEKGFSNLIKDEQNLYHKLVDLLNEYEKDMRWYYRPSVEVIIDSKFYLVGRYKLN